MECKLSCYYTIVFVNYELIDTLWNVNYATIAPQRVLIAELIDTLWNVNTSGSL